MGLLRSVNAVGSRAGLRRRRCNSKLQWYLNKNASSCTKVLLVAIMIHPVVSISNYGYQPETRSSSFSPTRSFEEEPDFCSLPRCHRKFGSDLTGRKEYALQREWRLGVNISFCEKQTTSQSQEAFRNTSIW